MTDRERAIQEVRETYTWAGSYGNRKIMDEFPCEVATHERAIRAERKLDEAVRLLERVNNTMQCLGCYDTDTDTFLAHKGESNHVGQG